MPIPVERRRAAPARDIARIDRALRADPLIRGVTQLAATYDYAARAPAMLPQRSP